jgi:group I intron endonuclease
MPNYQNGKVYKLTNNINDDEYVGSTANLLRVRLAGHRSDAKDESRTSAIYTAMRELGAENFDIILIENFPCADKNELNAREDYWIKQLKPVYNTKAAIFNVEKMKETAKRYKAAHKDAITEKRRLRHQANQEMISAQRKAKYQINKEQEKATNIIYRERNNEAIKQHQREYRQANKNRHRCEVCDFGTHCSTKMAQHNNTERHKLKSTQQ